MNKHMLMHYEKIVTTTLALIISFFIMNFDCEDHVSSQNGPVGPKVDTSSIKHLDTAMLASISLKVYEWDKEVLKQKLSVGTPVHFFNGDTNVIVDSTGNANLIFSVDSIPYQYGYSVSKTGFIEVIFKGWEQNNRIVDKTTIFKKDSVN